MRYSKLGMKWGSILLFILTIFSVKSFASDIENKDGKIIVRPKASDRALINPGKGWTMFGNANRQPKEVLDLCSLGYVRYQWSQIEPKEGEYRWDLIEKDMKSWTDLGRQFAFGVLAASSHSSKFWVTPKWVFDAGAKYDTFDLIDPKRPTTGVAGEKLVPIFDDPVYIEKLKNMIEAMAKHFDGRSDLAYIDIRSYGNWGEGHMYPFRKHEITAEKYKIHLEIHRKAFKKTLLALPGGNRPFKDLYPWAVENGITIRRDGICGNSDGHETAICDNKVPSVFEFYGSYEFLKKLGWWDGIKDKNNCGYRLSDCIETGKPSWCTLSSGGKSSLAMIHDQPDLIRKLTNRLGYHFVLTKAEWPEKIEHEPFEIKIDWENRGVASLFLPVTVKFALLDQNGNIVEIRQSRNSKPRQWRSDTPVTVTDSISFIDAPAGRYQLAVGLVQENKKDPDIKLGVELDSVNGWYLLGPVTMQAGATKQRVPTL